MLEQVINNKRTDIKKWKKKHEDIYIIGLEDVEGEYFEAFIYRTLGREEYKYLFLNYIDDMTTFQELVCETAILYPAKYDFENCVAGFPEVLSNMILESSGFAEGQALQLLATYREQMYEYDFQVDCMIHEAFPDKSIEEIQMWNNHKTMYYLSRAEFILAGIRGHNIMTIEDAISSALEIEEAIKDQEETGYDNNFYAGAQQEVYPEFQEQFDKMERDTPKPQQPAQQEISNSEADLLAMLGNNEASNGRSIANPHFDQGVGNSKMFPELSWFKAETELKGDID